MSDIRCAICGNSIERRPTNRWYPFCSDRCRLIDLGKWLSEDYRIPVKPEEDEDGEGFLGDRHGVDDLDED